MKKFLLVLTTSLLSIFILEGCSQKATMADYEKALSRYEQLNQKFFSNSELLSDRDAVKEVERINRKVENLYELEEKALRTEDYDEVVNELNDILDDFEDIVD